MKKCADAYLISERDFKGNSKGIVVCELGSYVQRRSKVPVAREFVKSTLGSLGHNLL